MYNIKFVMKKNLLYYKFTILFFFGFVFSLAQNLPYTEDFEHATNDSYSFTSNGKLFKIESSPTSRYPQGTFRVQGNYPGTGWNGLTIDNKYIDNEVQQNLELIQVLSLKVRDLILLRKIFIFF